MVPGSNPGGPTNSDMIKKYFSIFCLLISCTILFYVYYRSEFFWNGEKRDFYTYYYFISFLLILLSFITFFLSEKIKIYLAIIFSSIIFCFYLFEASLIYKYTVLSKKTDLIKRLNIYNATGKKYDVRSKLQIFNEMRKKNKNVMVPVFPYKFLNNNNLKIFPLSGVSNSTTIHCNENGYYFIYNSDRYGFNNPDKEWEKDEVEYVIIGDSFGFGDCVNSPNDIASVLRSLSNKTVLNLSYSGNGPLIEYATLKEFLPKKVKKILWIYNDGNDLENLELELKNKFLIKYLENNNFLQNLKDKQTLTDKIGKKFIENEKDKKIKFSFIKFLKIYHTRAIFLTPKQKSLKEFEDIIKLSKKLSKKNNTEFYFIYLPSHDFIISKNSKKSNYQDIKKTILRNNLPFIDIYNEVFEKESNPLKFFPFEMHGHLNEKGYRKVSEAIYRSLKK